MATVNLDDAKAHLQEIIAGLSEGQQVVIMQDGEPAFVVIPFDEYVRLFPEASGIPEGKPIPREVVGLTIGKRYPIVRAWREYKGLTQTEVAERMGISQAALSQMEAG